MEFYETFEILAFKRGWAPAANCTTGSLTLYHILIPYCVYCVAEAKEYTRTLCREVLEKGYYQVGYTKVFMRSDGFELMHSAITRFLGNVSNLACSLGYNNVYYVGQKVAKFQTMVRRIQATRKYHALKRATLFTQTMVRCFINKMKFKRILTKHREEQRLEAERIRLEHEHIARVKEAERIAKLQAEEQARDEAEKARLEAERQRIEAERLAIEAALDAERKRVAEEQARIAAEQERQRVEKEAYDARIQHLHNSCLHGKIDAVDAHLTQYPEDYYVTNPQRNHCTVLQSAILSGCVDLINYFRPKVRSLYCPLPPPAVVMKHML